MVRTFLSSSYIELTKVLMYIVEEISQSYQYLLHSIIIARTCSKVLGYLLFLPYWKYYHVAVSHDSSLSLYLGYIIEQYLIFRLPFDIIELIQTAWSNHWFELFLCWITPFFYFLPQELINRSSLLKEFFSLLNGYSLYWPLHLSYSIEK